MNSRVIFSLCDYSGSWSRPYLDAGYDVIRIDIRVGQDVRLMEIPTCHIHGILAAPPCTHFSKAGAQYWDAKGEAALLEGLSVVDACLRLVAICKPTWWALENPAGRIKKYIGDPAWSFQPCHFGDPWTKQTFLWGNFTPPTPLFSTSTPPVAPTMGDVTTLELGKNRRSETPMGFAHAFFNSNP